MVSDRTEGSKVDTGNLLTMICLFSFLFRNNIGLLFHMTIRIESPNVLLPNNCLLCSSRSITLVGGGMQDFSKDDLGLLSSSVVVSSDKDPLVHTHLQQSHDYPSVHQTHRVDDIKLTNIPDLLEPGDANKLEEPERDLYPWHTGSNIGSRFL